MTPKLLEHGENQCSVQSSMTTASDSLRQDKEAFVRSVLRAQFLAAGEELGDTLREGPEFARECLAESGSALTISEAQVLTGCVTSCLQKRYLRICQTAGHCNGRQAMQERIDSLYVTQGEAS